MDARIFKISVTFVALAAWIVAVSAVGVSSTDPTETLVAAALVLVLYVGPFLFYGAKISTATGAIALGLGLLALAGWTVQDFVAAEHSTALLKMISLPAIGYPLVAFGLVVERATHD